MILKYALSLCGKNLHFMYLKDELKNYGGTINEAGNKLKIYCKKYFIHHLGLLNQNVIFLEIK
jgi:hypothetical protein